MNEWTCRMSSFCAVAYAASSNPPGDIVLTFRLSVFISMALYFFPIQDAFNMK
jgi:hypothetical protein